MSAGPQAAAEVASVCLNAGNEAAWVAFVRRFQPLIAMSISRVVGRYGSPNTALIDDLVQETYLRLCRDNCRCLRDFQAKHDEAIFGYLKVIATSVALDYVRARARQKRRCEVEDDGSGPEASVSPAGLEQITLLREIERHLASTESRRDCTIFWLYYRQGFTTKDIASMPGHGLTQKGVESCIYRLTQLLREALAGSLTGNSILGKGNPPQSALGDVK